tara:strand:- start:23 stop:439 length:417 start_codon:yes stop_codon:yes gene_type:complete
MLKPFKINYPLIKTGGIYTFVSDYGINYEVRFARKKNNLLHATIAFGVLNEEFDGEEYVMTNKFEAYRVMSTIVIVFLNYIEQHPNVNTFEFVGEPTADEYAEFPKKRLTLYQRYLPKIFDKTWKKSVQGNRVIISKK